jgi:hypothetical protein
VATADDGRGGAGGLGRALALAAATVGLAAVTGAACVLSYSAVVAVARHSGVSAPLDKVYPLIIDAMLVVTGAAVLALRRAGLPSRFYCWLCFLALLALTAVASAVRSGGITLPGRPAEIGAAALPLVLVLASVGLVFALLQDPSRAARAARAGERRGQDGPPGRRPASGPGGSAQPGHGIAILPGGSVARPGVAAEEAQAPEQPQAKEQAWAQEQPQAQVQPRAADPDSALIPTEPGTLPRRSEMQYRPRIPRRKADE